MKPSVVNARESLRPSLASAPTVLLLLVATLTSAACGQKGPLRLPDENRPSATQARPPAAAPATATSRQPLAPPPASAASSARP